MEATQQAERERLQRLAGWPGQNRTVSRVGLALGIQGSWALALCLLDANGCEREWQWSCAGCGRSGPALALDANGSGPAL